MEWMNVPSSGCLKFVGGGNQAEAVRGSAGLGRGVESVRGSKFMWAGLLPGSGCGPCGLSDSVVASGRNWTGKVTGCDLKPSLSVFLNSWQGLFLTTYQCHSPLAILCGLDCRHLTADFY